MPVRVVDASVLAAWCFRESRASEALGLLQASDLYAPYLLAYELTSIARRKATMYSGSLDVLSEALQTALALPIHWSEVDHLASCNWPWMPTSPPTMPVTSTWREH
jgi:predicted nucleic acid-binding protein